MQSVQRILSTSKSHNKCIGYAIFQVLSLVRSGWFVCRPHFDSFSLGIANSKVIEINFIGWKGSLVELLSSLLFKTPVLFKQILIFWSLFFFSCWSLVLRDFLYWPNVQVSHSEEWVIRFLYLEIRVELRKQVWVNSRVRTQEALAAVTKQWVHTQQAWAAALPVGPV